MPDSVDLAPAASMASSVPDDVARLHARGSLRIRRGLLWLWFFGAPTILLAVLVAVRGGGLLRDGYGAAVVLALLVEAAAITGMLGAGLADQRRARSLTATKTTDAQDADAALDEAILDAEEHDDEPSVLLDAPTGLPWEKR